MLPVMNGILLVDKPSGWTSFDVVAKVRGVIKQETGQKKPKVGHTGTLDPLATGLLVLVVGTYTKRVPELSKAGKTYQVTMKLGETSTTGDNEGKKTHVSDKQPSEADVQEALSHFVGEIEQIPPAYSAVKVGGRRAYELARAGKEVKIEPRKVTIYSIELTGYEYPFARFTTKVSSGTYARSLVEDVGTKLSTGAYMSALRRTAVGTFSLDRAVSPEDVTPGMLKSFLKTGI